MISFDLEDFRKIAAIIAAVVSFVAHPLYVWAMVRKETKPHLFTWVVSSFIAGSSIFLFNKAEGGDPIYMLVGDFIGLSFIAILSIFMGNGKEKDSWDWSCLIGALIGVGIYVFYRNAFIAFAAVLFAESLGLIPTIRKTYDCPEQEDFLAWTFTFTGNFLNLLAVNWENCTDKVYVITILIIDGIVYALIIRGKLVNKRCQL